MSFTVAQNLGRKKLSLLYSALKRGAKLKECAETIGLSQSRTSRIINALFEFAPVPKPWTIDYLKQAEDLLRFEADLVKEDRVKMGNVLPFTQKAHA